MKKWQRITVNTIVIVAILFILTHFGINLWIKHYLPTYIKNNADYKIQYKELKVNPYTGYIFASKVSIQTVQHKKNILKIHGTVDSVNISRIKLFNILISKNIEIREIGLVSPNLKIILSKPADKKSDTKKRFFNAKNISIHNGTVEVFQPDSTKYLSVSKLNINIKNLRMKKKSFEEKIPFVFDSYSLNAQSFYFQPDDIYRITTEEMATKDDVLDIKEFKLLPLLPPQEFMRKYPQKKNLFEFSTQQMKFKDIDLKNNKLSLSNVSFYHSKLIKYATNTKTTQKQKDFKYDVVLNNLHFYNTSVQLVSLQTKSMVSGEKINLSANELIFNNETSKNFIPFLYKDFSLTGRSLNVNSNKQNFSIENIQANPKYLNLKNIAISNYAKEKTNYTLKIKEIQSHFNKLGFLDKKLKIKASNVIINGVNGDLNLVKNKPKPLHWNHKLFPIEIEQFSFRNINLNLFQNNNKTKIVNANGRLNSLVINEKSIKNKIPAIVGNYDIKVQNIGTENQHYTFAASQITTKKGFFSAWNILMLPKYSRTDFVRRISKEKDLYTLKVKQLNAFGTWDFLSNNKRFFADQIILAGLNANIYRNKIPADDTTIKPMYNELLRKIKIPFHIKSLLVKNSNIVYEEETEKSNGAGKLIFGNFNLTAHNINPCDINRIIPIKINCNFMNASPMLVNWNIHVAKLDDSFSINGEIRDLPASRANLFTEPYLKIRTTGTINRLNFDFSGNKKGLAGSLQMVQNDLKVAVLKESGEKNKILSTVANIFVETNVEKFPEKVIVESIERDPTKSFFNLLWKGLQAGLKKELLGI